MSGKRSLTAVAMLALSAAFMVPPAVGKCSKECKTFLAQRKTSCIDSCNGAADKKSKKTCKKIFCKPAFKSWSHKCKKATAPTTTATNCGSPSGAFIDG